MAFGVSDTVWEHGNYCVDRSFDLATFNKDVDSTYSIACVFQFKTEDGLRFKVKATDDDSKGVQFEFDRVKIKSEGGLKFSPKKVPRGALQWESEDITITAIT